MLYGTIQDMELQEILGIFKPILYLIAPIFGIIVIVIVIKLWKRTSNFKIFSFMDSPAHTEDEKREQLGRYFQSAMGTVVDMASNKRRCCICKTKYSLIEESRNSRGDIVKKAASGSCPVCNFRIGYSRSESNPQGEFILSRTATESLKEAKYKETFDKLKFYNDYYHPYINETVDSDGDSNVSVTITIR